MSILSTKQLTKQYGTEPNIVKALDGVSISIEPGEFVAIIGTSGSGKSTLLNMLGGLDRPTSGSVRVDNYELGKLKDEDLTVFRRQRIGFIFQNYNLVPVLNVYENIVMPIQLDGKKPDQKFIKEIVALLGLEKKLYNMPNTLSGGQQQRVAIARTLAPSPKVLFMDEPLSNLDAKLRLEMRSELQRLHIDTGSTFIYVTHDQMEAMTLATKICLIENGVLQQYDAPLDVYAKPNNVFVADFVGNPAINFIDASGAQQSDGTLTLSALDGMQLSFRPKEPLDVAAWYERADAEDKARRDAENARALDKKSVEKGNKDVLFRYHVARVNETEDFGDEAALTDGDFVLGVRPEFLRLSDSGAIEGEIYSAMPTGMETTVKVRVGSFLLTGVVFGGVLYRIGQKIRLDFQGDGVVLFSRRNGRMIAQGSLSVK